MKRLMLLVLIVASSLIPSNADAWWWFNKGKDAVKAADKYKELREKYFELLADPESTKEDLDKAKKELDNSFTDAMDSIQDFGTSVPGTTLQGPPTPAKLLRDAAESALEDALKQQFNNKLDNGQLDSLLPGEGILLNTPEVQFLNFAQYTDPGTGPLLWSETGFTATIGQFSMNGEIFGINDLSAGSFISSGSSVAADLATLYGDSNPPWDPYDNLKFSYNYSDATLVRIDSVNYDLNTISGNMFYLDVGPVNDGVIHHVPEPSSCFLLLSGVAAIAAIKGRSRQRMKHLQRSRASDEPSVLSK